MTPISSGSSVMVKAHICSRMQSPPEQRQLGLRASGQLNIMVFLLVGLNSLEVNLKIPSFFFFFFLPTIMVTSKQCQTAAQESPS